MRRHRELQRRLGLNSWMWLDPRDAPYEHPAFTAALLQHAYHALVADHAAQQMRDRAGVHYQRVPIRETPQPHWPKDPDTGAWMHPSLGKDAVHYQRVPLKPKRGAGGGVLNQAGQHAPGLHGAGWHYERIPIKPAGGDHG
jgi:hypothetical protein